MSVNLDGLNPRQLKQLIADANKKKKILEKRAPAARVRAKLERIAQSEGYTLAELFGSAHPVAGKSGRAKPSRAKSSRAGSSLKGRAVPPKYRNPTNAKETWTGRGRQPRWVAELVAAGTSLESLIIAAPESAN